MKNKTLHIMMVEKFMSPFINVINNHFKREEHKIVIMDTPNIECPPELKEQEGLIWITKKHELVKLSYLLNTHNKIILHGLFLSSLITSLFFQPWLLKKCYWVMWGGDFYFPEKQSWLKKQVIKRIRNFVTYMKGDFEYLKKYYGAKGTYHESFMYPSNLYKEYQIKTKEDGGIINIQVGNSADSTNNHIEIFENLRKFKDENIKIYAPLSYSDQDHAKDVIAKGKEMFGDKFVALTDFMSFEKYLEFLADIDIAIFAHNRQQGMGNTISLLGMGKKVYMKNDITPWTLFGEIGVKVFDFNNIDLESINSEVMNENIKIIKSYFSEDKYIRQLEILFK